MTTGTPRTRRPIVGLGSSVPALLPMPSFPRPVVEPQTAVRPGTGAGVGGRLAGDSLAALAVICLWLVVQTLVLGGLSGSRAQQQLYSRFRAELAAATAPVGGVITPGAPVGLLRIPSLGLETVVTEGTASGDLLSGPGHRRDTVLPGQQGVSLVYGRAVTYGGVFSDVPHLRPGTKIVVRTAQGRAVFTVDRVRRAGDRLPPALVPGAARLTLVTAEGTGRLDALRASSTVYVDATHRGTGFVPPAGRLVAVPDAEHAMGIDTAALPLLVVCLAGLVSLVLLTLVMRQRWSDALVWLVSAPVVLALAWGTTDVAMRLLPNVF